MHGMVAMETVQYQEVQKQPLYSRYSTTVGIIPYAILHHTVAVKQVVGNKSGRKSESFSTGCLAPKMIADTAREECAHGYSRPDHDTFTCGHVLLTFYVKRLRQRQR